MVTFQQEIDGIINDIIALLWWIFQSLQFIVKIPHYYHFTYALHLFISLTNFLLNLTTKSKNTIIDLFITYQCLFPSLLLNLFMKYGLPSINASSYQSLPLQTHKSFVFSFFLIENCKYILVKQLLIHLHFLLIDKEVHIWKFTFIVTHYFPWLAVYVLNHYVFRGAKNQQTITHKCSKKYLFFAYYFRDK